MSAALSRVEAYLAALREQSLFRDEKTPGSILSYIAFYQKRAPRRRIAFRTAGFLLLFLSISLPFITQSAPEACQARVASSLSWLIAVVAAASSFFNWQKAWQLHIQTELTLRFALSEWEMRTAEARAESSEEAALKILKAALQQLTKTVTEAVASETAQYFEGVKAPQAPTAQPTRT
jgi:hypothetical protein